MRRLFLKLLLFLPVGAAVVWVNWRVDPAHYFRARQSVPSDRSADRRLLNALEVHGSAPVDETFNHRRFIDETLQSGRRFDIVCYGTSVAKPIHEGLFPGKSFFNAAVTASRLSTMIAVDQMFVDHEARARRVILVVDPWGLTEPSRIAVDFEDELDRALARLKLVEPIATRSFENAERLAGVAGDRRRDLAFIAENGILHPYDRLISVRYCQLSLATLWSKRFAPALDASRKAPVGNRSRQLTVYRDGSVDWSDELRQRTTNEIRSRFADFVYSQARALELKTRASRFSDLRALVNDLVSAGVQVEIWIPPISPWYFVAVTKILADKGIASYLAETEDLLRSMQKTWPITVRGSYDPRKSGADDKDFIDPYHLRREAMIRVWGPNHPSRK